MDQLSFFPYLWISLFLVVCTAFDFYHAKLSNKFIITSLIVSVLCLLVFMPMGAWLMSLASFVLMFVIGFLLFKFRILGGGDIKALCIVALFLSPLQLKDFVLYSIMWAGTYAFIFYMISGQLFSVVLNTIGVYRKFAVANHKIPFTFGLLFGWFSLFTMGVLSW